MPEIKPAAAWDLPALWRVSGIIRACGRDMAARYGLRHWDHSRLILFGFTVLDARHRRIYLVTENGKNRATFRVNRAGEWLRLSKLAALPEAAGKGLGSFCVSRAEEMARREGLKGLTLEVYDKSEHAVAFYRHRGFTPAGEVRTRKYTELVMRKEL